MSHAATDRPDTATDRMIAVVRFFWTPIVLSGFGLAVVLIVWASGDGVLARTITDALIRTVLVVGLYIFIGNSGVLAFGHIAFMLIGGYAVAWLTLSPFKKSFALELPPILADNQFPLFPSAIAAGLLPALVAAVVGIPIMRLSGIAASIATFAVLAIFYTVYSNWDSWTFGASTLVGIPIYVNMWIALAWASFAMFVAYIYQQTKFGLALRASREDPIAARAAGINIPKQRLVAFVVSAFFMGIAGALQAHFLGSLIVNGFWLGITFLSLAMLIIGGQRSLTGAVVGVTVVSTIIELLRQVEAGVDVGGFTFSLPGGFQELGLAVLMIVILIYRPAGIMGGLEVPWPFAGGQRLLAGGFVIARAERASASE